VETQLGVIGNELRVEGFSTTRSLKPIGCNKNELRVEGFSTTRSSLKTDWMEQKMNYA